MVPSGEVVKTITADDGLHEVRILRHTDGTFGFEEWYFSSEPHNQCWLPSRQPMRTLADFAETAEREARAGVDWLIGQPSR